MWAAADESREQIVGLYHRVWAHSDATINTLELDAVGHVPHWPKDRSEVTLDQILVHMTAETYRHAGHADIIRELIDGAVGLRPDDDNMAPGDQSWWAEYRSRLERVARQADSAPGRGEGSPGCHVPGVRGRRRGGFEPRVMGACSRPHTEAGR
jgi:hypothetical protein